MIHTPAQLEMGLFIRITFLSVSLYKTCCPFSVTRTANLSGLKKGTRYDKVGPNLLIHADVNAGQCQIERERDEVCMSDIKECKV
jgi:hypothetical protein